MTDQWNEPLHCPQCRQTGSASLTQPAGVEKPIVNRVSDGFKAVYTEHGPNFHCGACDIPAQP
jgi:hypothetical protein